MSETFKASDHREWEEAGLEKFGDFSDCITYYNQEEFGDSSRGQWYYIPDAPANSRRRVIYFGTFSDDHSPGASCYTQAEVYDLDDEGDAENYLEWKEELESSDEYLEDELEDEEDLDEDDEFE